MSIYSNVCSILYIVAYIHVASQNEEEKNWQSPPQSAHTNMHSSYFTTPSSKLYIPTNGMHTYLI